MSPRYEIIIYNLDDVKHVYSWVDRVRQEVQIATPYAAVAFAGVDYFLRAHHNISQQYPALQIPCFIDCGPYPGYAMAALRAGAKHLYVDGTIQTFESLKSMAQKVEAVLVTQQDKPNLRLNINCIQAHECFNF